MGEDVSQKCRESPAYLDAVFEFCTLESILVFSASLESFDSFHFAFVIGLHYLSFSTNTHAYTMLTIDM